MTGYVNLARGIMDHPIIGARRKFSDFEAWTWMLFAAAWKPHRCSVGGLVVSLERGQFAHSTRHMAKAWKWPETNVRRFLDRLKTDAMIGAETGAGITIITICNYSSYQFSAEQSGAATGAATGAEVAQDRRKVEKGKQENKEKDAADAAPVTSSEEADLYRRGKAVLGRDAGGLIKNLVKAKDGSIPLARAAIETASTKENAREYIGACISVATREPQHQTRWDPRL